MLVFVIRRVLQSVVVVFVMSALVFVGVYLIADPIEILIDPPAAQAEIDAARERLGLDGPLYQQYFSFLAGALQGDLGTSFVFAMPALQLIVERMTATVELALTAMLVALSGGMVLGLWAGMKPDTLIDRCIMTGSILGFSVPPFWFAILLIMVFAVELGWLPPGGRGETVEVLGLELSVFTLDGLVHLILPAGSLALYKISLVIRMTRATTREVMLQDYIKFARAKGLKMGRVVRVHVLKNTMIPVVTVMGLELGNVIAFAVVTETVFVWPGMGKLIIDSIQVLDRPVVVAYLMVTVFLFIIINLLVDISYSLLDPRIRLQDSGQ